MRVESFEMKRMTDLEKIEELRREFVAAENPDIDYFRSRMDEEISSRDQNGKERLFEAFKESAESACAQASKALDDIADKLKRTARSIA